jgi:hypothetical protein
MPSESKTIIIDPKEMFKKIRIQNKTNLMLFKQDIDREIAKRQSVKQWVVFDNPPHITPGDTCLYLKHLKTILEKNRKQYTTYGRDYIAMFATPGKIKNIITAGRKGMKTRAKLGDGMSDDESMFGDEPELESDSESQAEEFENALSKLTEEEATDWYSNWITKDDIRTLVDGMDGESADDIYHSIMIYKHKKDSLKYNEHNVRKLYDALMAGLDNEKNFILRKDMPLGRVVRETLRAIPND